MQVKEVLLVLTDRWADWEASYAIAEINSAENYSVRTISADSSPKTSIGGLKAQIDYTVSDYKNYDKLAMLILPGGYSWEESRHQEIADFVRKVHELNIPVAAICGAAIFLAKHGFLNNIKHTGDEHDYFMDKLRGEVNYKGQSNFVLSQLTIDGGFITANETAALELAREIFHILKLDTRDKINTWYDAFKYGMIR
jgi:putative intracellular protease/amidase